MPDAQWNTTGVAVAGYHIQGLPEPLDPGISPAAFPSVLSRYVATEKQAGRIARDVDEDAFGFLLTGALHNLLVAGEAWPRPTRPDLERILTAAAAIAAQPDPPLGGPDGTAR